MGGTNTGMYRTQIKNKSLCTDQRAGEPRVERATQKEQMGTEEAKGGRARMLAPPFVQIVVRRKTTATI